MSMQYPCSAAQTAVVKPLNPVLRSHSMRTLLVVAMLVGSAPAAIAQKPVATTDAGARNIMTNTNEETAILAGGCFWGMEDLLRKIPGVISTEVGYSGGTTSNATYNDVKTGRTGHAESVKIVFDRTKVSYETILDHFFRMHDPTTMNQQGNDRGSQYRSVIFFTSEQQRQTAEAVKAKVNTSGKWQKPLVTQIVAAGPFFTAEEYHQDYLEKHPDGYTCHFYRY